MPRRNLSLLKMLIVDDEHGNLQMLKDTLTFYRTPVITADSAAKALEQVAMHKDIKIILADISMPERDGYDLLKDLRLLPHLNQVTIIALTANAMRGDEERAIAAGFDGYISKPMPRPGDLIELILQIASRKLDLLAQETPSMTSTPTNGGGVPIPPDSPATSLPVPSARIETQQGTPSENPPAQPADHQKNGHA